MKKIAVIGAGAWGTALAITAHNAGNQVIIWAFEEDTVNEINEAHRTMYLPSAHLPESLKATANMQEALADADFVLFATPAQFNRSVFSQMHPYLKDETPLVLCAKGIELKELLMFVLDLFLEQLHLTKALFSVQSLLRKEQEVFHLSNKDAFG